MGRAVPLWHPMARLRLSACPPAAIGSAVAARLLPLSRGLSGSGRRSDDPLAGEHGFGDADETSDVGAGDSQSPG